MIKLENLRKSYDDSNRSVSVLNGISLSIKKGEALAILGPSGSGKTTLLDVIGTLLKFDSGSYYFYDKEISTLKEKEICYLRNQYFGFIFQAFHLIPNKSVYENVRLPFRYSRFEHIDLKNKIVQLLNEVGLIHKIDIKTKNLSGGEKQRAAIARAMVLDPELILADEPTGNLDSVTGERIISLLISLWKKGRTLIMVTHNEKMAATFPRVIRIHDGRIIYDGVL